MKRPDLLTTTQKRTKKLLDRCIGSDDFEADVAHCRQRKSNIYALIGNTANIIKKYKLPQNTIAFLSNYISTAGIDYSLINPPAYIIGEDGYHSISSSAIERSAILLSEEVKDHHKRFINLLISPTATQAELKEFLSVNWELIKQEQRRLTGEEQKRVKERPQAKRDARVKRLFDEGKTTAQIQEILNADESDSTTYEMAEIRKIISRVKERRNAERDS